MTIVISMLALIELSFFLLYDFRSSQGNLSERYAIRLMSCAGGILLILFELMTPNHCEMQSLASDLSSATAMLVIYPCSFEKPKTSLCTALCLLSFSVITLMCFGFKQSGALGFKSQRVVISFIPMIIFVLLYYLYVAYKRFSGIRAMFRNTAVWHNVEEHSRFIYSLVFLVAGMLFMCGVPASGHLKSFLSFVSIMMYLSLYAVLFLRAMTGRTYVLNREAERRIKEIIKGNLRTSYIEKVEEDKKMNNLYRRIVMYLEEKKPYLDQSFDMADLADRMLTNKLYLSKTINLLSGRNFRQFVNYYRVRRAIELFKSDPRLKINEVSEMSGFHTVVTFNMSFKVNTGKTPTEWLSAYATEIEK